MVHVWTHNNTVSTVVPVIPLAQMENDVQQESVSTIAQRQIQQPVTADVSICKRTTSTVVVVETAAQGKHNVSKEHVSVHRGQHFVAVSVSIPNKHPPTAASATTNVHKAKAAKTVFVSALQGSKYVKDCVSTQRAHPTTVVDVIMLAPQERVALMVSARAKVAKMVQHKTAPRKVAAKAQMEQSHAQVFANMAHRPVRMGRGEHVLARSLPVKRFATAKTTTAMDRSMKMVCACVVPVTRSGRATRDQPEHVV
tara:strand:- start:8066 stop:8827 length:762 start_codon:yes stop_codon:yes gene_type:complete